MGERFVTRGFVGRRDEGAAGPLGDDDHRGRTPPGQYLTTDFPVLSAGPTPRTPLDHWSLSIEGLVANPARWSWEEFLSLPSRDWVVDISCVTKWTHLDMRWKGVSVDTLLEGVELDPRAAFVIAYSDGGYTTNLPLADVLNNQAFVAYEYDGKPLAPEHGGPARLVVPARYFWKSAKWVRGLRIQATDEPGFWESLGYHNRGDQRREERYSGD
jgi:DMSO/TMAO reductase YedYZ molybdopterin-dependent catalytic subunit